MSDGGGELEILDAGIQTTVQDYPGRQGYLKRGFFPAGPMDHLACRLVNLLVGNPLSSAVLEVTLGRLRVRFARDAVIALGGAEAGATLNGEPAPSWESIPVRTGDELRLGMAKGPGFRSYLAIAGGIDVPPVLGSRATYTMGALGGLDGRALKKGDRLPIGAPVATIGSSRRRLRADAIPVYAQDWEIEVMVGPQAEPDFLMPEDMDAFLSQTWGVDHNSNRVGIRLGRTSFRWARASGGVAGGHPSNILDDGYPVGGINLNGDTPVILGPDGPTAGGFVVIATVVHGALWKLGQLRPGSDKIRFKAITIDEAIALAQAVNERLADHAVEVLQS